MSYANEHRITTLLDDFRLGSESAKEELIALAYPELQRIAARYVRQESSDPTMRTTGLVNEMYQRLFGALQLDWKSRALFFAAVAREMRHTLVDYARARDPNKRPAGRMRISLDEIGTAEVAGGPDQDVVALDDALSQLEAVDPRASRVVELRYFSGLSEREAAEVMGVTVSTLKRDWNFAKAWLFNHLQSDAG